MIVCTVLGVHKDSVLKISIFSVFLDEGGTSFFFFFN